MNRFEPLYLTAEVSVTLLGFVAVFIALTNREGKFDPADRHFIQGFVVTSIIAIVLALIPRAFSLYLNDDRTWEYSLWVFFILGSVSAFLEAKAQWLMSKDEAAKIHIGWHIGAWGLAGCTAIAVLLGLFNPQLAPQHYVTGVILLVVTSLFVFTGLIFRRFF